MKMITVLAPQLWLIRVGKTQTELIASVRKNLHMPTRSERPSKGGGYRRPQNRKDVYDD